MAVFRYMAALTSTLADSGVSSQARALRPLAEAVAARALGRLRAREEETAKAEVPVLLYCNQPVGKVPVGVESNDSMVPAVAGVSRGSRTSSQRILVRPPGCLRMTFLPACGGGLGKDD